MSDDIETAMNTVHKAAHHICIAIIAVVPNERAAMAALRNVNNDMKRTLKNWYRDEKGSQIPTTAR